jgi:hypothetical protein
VLGEIDADELPQGRRLNQTSFTAKPFERALERLHGRLLGREAATLDTLRPATAGAVPIRPPGHTAITGVEREHLSLLHKGSLLSSPPLRRESSQERSARSM